MVFYSCSILLFFGMEFGVDWIRLKLLWWNSKLEIFLLEFDKIGNINTENLCVIPRILFFLIFFNIILFHIFEIMNLVSGGRTFERLNVERLILVFWNLKIANVKSYEVQLFDFLIYEVIFSLFLIIWTLKFRFFFNFNALIFYNFRSCQNFRSLLIIKFKIKKCAKLRRFPKIVKFWNCSSLRYFALHAISLTLLWYKFIS